jgi:hypothetical protein
MVIVNCLLFQKKVNEWVVFLVVRNRHGYGHDCFARSQKMHGNPYEHGNNRYFTQ